jgi:hypothetical protein
MRARVLVASLFVSGCSVSSASGPPRFDLVADGSADAGSHVDATLPSLDAPAAVSFPDGACGFRGPSDWCTTNALPGAGVTCDDFDQGTMSPLFNWSGLASTLLTNTDFVSPYCSFFATVPDAGALIGAFTQHWTSEIPYAGKAELSFDLRVPDPEACDGAIVARVSVSEGLNEGFAMLGLLIRLDAHPDARDAGGEAGDGELGDGGLVAPDGGERDATPDAPRSLDAGVDVREGGEDAALSPSVYALTVTAALTQEEGISSIVPLNALASTNAVRVTPSGEWVRVFVDLGAYSISNAIEPTVGSVAGTVGWGGTDAAAATALSAMSSIAGAVTSANVFGGDASAAYFDIGVALEPATHAARVGCSVFVDNVVTSVGP